MRPLALGVGNTLFQDEGVGVHIINRLKRDYAELPYDFADGGTGGISILDIIRPYKKVVIIDAVKTNIRPGSVVKIDRKEIRSHDLGVHISLHQTDIYSLLEVVDSLGIGPDITFIGIVISLLGYGYELSPCIQERFGTIVWEVARLLKEELK